MGDGGNGRIQRIGHHHEVVVLGGDFDGAVGEVFDGMVAAVVAEGEARGLGPQGDGQELVPQADAHDGEFAEKVADGLDGVGEGGRVGGAVGEEDAVGAGGEDVGSRGLGREYADAGAEGGQGAEGVVFDAEVEDGDEG